MEERVSTSYNQAYPRVPRAPRGWASSDFNSRLGLTYLGRGATAEFSRGFKHIVFTQILHESRGLFSARECGRQPLDKERIEINRPAMANCRPFHGLAGFAT
jgi:hypothetical protein